MDDIFLVTYYDMASWVCLGKEEVAKSIQTLSDWEKSHDVFNVLEHIVVEKVVNTGWSPKEINPTYTGKEFLEEYGF